MKKRLGTLLAVCFIRAAPVAYAKPFPYPYGGFSHFADSGSLKPFCRDLGGILGSATFHSGRSLGLSGWDFGAQGGMQFYPDKNNRILRNNGVKIFGLPWVQAEVGLPFAVDGFVRGINYQGLTVAGVGVRWGLLKSNDKPWAPQLLAASVGHSVVHQDFSASHFGANLVGSMGTQMFTPYLGVGFDLTRLQVRSSIFDPTQNGVKVTTFESRYTAGMQLKPWQFFYIHGAYVLMHGQSGTEAGLGLRF
jgi:hypothetical protein